MKVVLIIQTYYISPLHLIAWAECKSAGMDCLILLNNENKVFESYDFSTFPENLIESISPFTADTILEIGLPVLPFQKSNLSRCNWWNSDYGFYIAENIYSKINENDIYFLKVDHDVLLHGISWPSFIKHLELTRRKVVTLTVNHGNLKNWKWANSSVPHYGEHHAWGVFGLQGMHMEYCKYLKKRRIIMYKQSNIYSPSFVKKDIDVNGMTLPICEAFFHEELRRLNLHFVELFKQFPWIQQSYKHSTGDLINSILYQNVEENPFFIFHAVKPFQ